MLYCSRPSADKSHGALAESSPDRCALFWVNYELFTPGLYIRHDIGVWSPDHTGMQMLELAVAGNTPRQYIELYIGL